MQEEDFEREIKVLVVGNGGVGKTSMIRRFCKGQFTDEYKKTIGVDFLEKTQYVKSLGEDVKLMLWDTAGQEEFDSITRTYYRGAAAAVLAFSTTDRQSFDAIAQWKKKVEAECGNIPMALVQNKVDLLDQAVVIKAETEALANKTGLKFYRMCVKKGLNVGEVFEYLAELAVNRKDEDKPTTPTASSRIGSIDRSKAPIGSGFQAESRVPTSPSRAEAQPSSPALVLKPTRQRTNGKKRFLDKVPSCSLI